MRTVWLFSMCLLSVDASARCPSDKVSNKVKLKEFVPWTEMDNGEPVATEPCWWDLNRSDCAKCKDEGEQCGFPMHMWCQNRNKVPKSGCTGIHYNKYTRSSKGYPCYSDPESKDCAWCMPGKVQCKPNEQSNKCGSYCKGTIDQKCDGVPTTCLNIPGQCGYNAHCKRKSQKCVCDDGYTGNGFQCVDDNTGLIETNPSDEVEITLNTCSKFWVFPGGSNEFNTLTPISDC